MKAIHQSVRLSPIQFQALIKLAEQQQSSRYRVLSDVIAKGFEAFQTEHGSHLQMAEMADELAAISVRLTHVERLLDRTLYVSCSSYVFARSASAQRKLADTAATSETLDAFNRQRALAEETPS